MTPISAISVLAPNAILRAAVTALARTAKNGTQKQTVPEKQDTDHGIEALWRSPARYLWVMLLARIYETAPLACPQCGADMQIIAFVTDGVPIPLNLSLPPHPCLHSEADFGV